MEEKEEKVSKKVRALKIVRNVLISVVVLVVLIGGAGVAYIWYVGQNSDTQAVESAVDPVNPAPKITPKKPDPKAKVGASVQMLTSPIKPGSEASITIRTLPTAKCKIKVEYNKIAAKDPGLKDQTADEFGIATWDWTVGPNTPVGKWPVKVTCSHNKQSGMVQGDLEVKRVIE